MSRELMEARFQYLASRVRRQGAPNVEGSQVIFSSCNGPRFSRLVYWPASQGTAEELTLIQSVIEPLDTTLVGTTQVIALGRSARGGIVPVMSRSEDVFDIASGATLTRDTDYKIPPRSRQRAAEAFLNTIENAISS